MARLLRPGPHVAFVVRCQTQVQPLMPNTMMPFLVRKPVYRPMSLDWIEMTTDLCLLTDEQSTSK